ncbi:MAG TPA: right-handed parallel beta-helix repeat-containing protein [Solirubrobacterales bacterium]|nr:right-handed parallel beta-helix repeat-containing protein [Solirubrobacterales bacterium]
MGRRMRDRLWISTAAAVGVLAVPAVAFAHLERPSYWPDPAPDRSVTPAAGGEVPKPRPLATAVTGKGPGEVRVVCQGADGGESLARLRQTLAKATTKGWRLRPSLDREKVSDKKAARLVRLNRKLARQCEYHSVQDAVNASGNNDRVVVMPGIYREPQSRRSPVNDPRCADLTTTDTSGAETPSYAYQVKCPNDQNLIYVQGRKLGGAAPEPPLQDRHGIPDEGPCVRCNLQIEGSGLRPEDVIMDGGKGYRTNRPDARPKDVAKHVVMRVDRADGFVGRNFLLRGALEFGFYTEETDGILLDRTKFFWAADYGHLSFTTDHHEVRNCEAIGAGDAGVYPGAAPETGSQAVKSFYPDAPRINTVIKKCDLHANVLAYSGSMGNAVRITRNEVYGNTAGISTDTISAAGHPGFPADSVEIDHNNIYSNNLNLYGVDDPSIEPIVGVLPVGVGIFWAGHNDGNVHDNYIFDNWRFGAQLLAVPDAVVELVDDFEPEGGVDPGISCITAPSITTSCGNQFHDNKMGVAPPGFQPSPAVDDYGNHFARGQVLPNGVDFWWDEFLGNNGNCWYENTGPNGRESSVTGPGPGTPPDVLPGKPGCGAVIGAGDVAKQLNLVNCFLARGGGDPALCDWFDMPPRPNSARAMAYAREQERRAERLTASEDGERIAEYFERRAGELEGTGE